MTPSVATDEPPVLWRPSVDARATCTLGRFMDHVGALHGRRLETFDDAYAWSVEDLGAFWDALCSFAGIHWHTRPSAPLGRRSMPGAEWFPGGTLSYSEHALGAGFDRPDDAAIIGCSQTRPSETWTWARLIREVAQLRSWLHRTGVGPGDRVAAYLPNVPEAIAGLLATASLGAVWVSCAPEFGTRSVLDRLGQVAPTVLLAVDGYRYGEVVVERCDEVRRIREALPSLRATLSLPYLGTAPLPGSTSWEAVRELDPDPLSHVPVPFHHPLYVLFSSGTTALPKPIVHATGGILLEHVKALSLHHDLGRGDRLFWFTTTGWMMWNYLVSGLAVGATVICFDGNPGYPDLTTLWEMAGEVGATLFGTSAPFLMACRKAGLEPGRVADLSAVRQVGSTGAPLPPEGFRWVADALPGVQVNSISGGTDVCTAFLGMNPLVPVWEGEISRPLLGCDVAAFGPTGVEVGTGDEGELVVRSPMPSMPIGLWGDDDGSRYRGTYFDRFPGVWCHGDWIQFTERGSAVISGRSDATLNRGGVRSGTAELYAVVESMAEVSDCIAVHLEDGDALWLFVVTERPLDDGLRRRIREVIRRELSPRHVPDHVEQVPAVPRTLSGKKLEVPVKRILHGARVEDVASEGALADPASLLPFVHLGEQLRSRSTRPPDVS